MGVSMLTGVIFSNAHISILYRIASKYESRYRVYGGNDKLYSTKHWTSIKIIESMNISLQAR